MHLVPFLVLLAESLGTGEIIGVYVDRSQAFLNLGFLIDPEM